MNTLKRKATALGLSFLVAATTLYACSPKTTKDVKTTTKAAVTTAKESKKADKTEKKTEKTTAKDTKKADKTDKNAKTTTKATTAAKK